MTTAITSATQTNPTPVSETQARPVAKVAGPKPTPSQSQSSAKAITDTVKISSAAQELMETAAQTAREAGNGDHQAQRLLAKEAAARKSE